MRDDAAREFKRGVGGVVGGARVGLPASSQRCLDVRRAEARHGLHLAEQIVEHIAPVAQHVDDDAAAVFLAIVPGRPLGRDRIAFEHPVAELAAHGENSPKKPVSRASSASACRAATACPARRRA